MSRIRIGIISPVDVAFPAVREAFTVLWPEASSVCLLDESLYADFVNPDFSVSPEYPDEAYARIAELFSYSKTTGADGIIFCGSVFGPLVEEFLLSIFFSTVLISLVNPTIPSINPEPERS